MPLTTTGTSMRRWLTAMASRPSRSTAMVTKKFLATPMAPHVAPKARLLHPTFQFQHTNGFRAQRFRRPLLFPEPTGETCDHAQFSKARGCVKDPNWEKDGLMRALLDRSSPLYKVIYNQRTACERINSQAQALGIERPKVRNIHSVRNLNTLIYVVINVRALAKAKSINKGLLHMI